MLLLAGVLAVLFEQCTGPIISQYKLKQLTKGLPQDAVIRLIGLPASKNSKTEWIYERWGNCGWATVHFKEDGSFSSVSQEVVFP